MNLLLAIAATAVFTQGEPAYFCWTPPVERKNGSTLEQDAIKEYEIIWSCDTDRRGEIVVPQDPTKENICIPFPQELLGYCGATIVTIDTNNIYSTLSEPIEFLVKLPKPAQGGFR